MSVENDNLTQPLSSPIPPSVQPDPLVSSRRNKIFLIISVVVLFGLFGGVAYYLGAKGTKVNLTTNQDQPTVASVSPSVSSVDPTANWITYTSNICGISLKYPQGWIIVDSDTPTQGNYNFPCFIINSPDFKIPLQSDFFDGSYLGVRRTLKGTTYTGMKNVSTTINTLEDYLKAINSEVEIDGAATNYVTEIQNKTYGSLNGKYFVTSARIIEDNFAFEGGNYIYNMFWSKEPQDQYQNQLEKIPSTFKFTQ